MKVLIIGLGSIAKKHINALKIIDIHTGIYALRSDKEAKVCQGVTNIFSWEDIPKDINFVIISNPTSEHYKSIKQSIQLCVPLFIEKPPVMKLNDADELIKLIKGNNIRTYVAFNLRFHPVIQWLKNNLPLNKVIEVQSYCGSYLPDWRPEKDYRQVYSSQKKLGGGVHLDLLHELDYIRWIFGEPDRTISFKRLITI
jgi:predicted dehydrogenase